MSGMMERLPGRPTLPDLFGWMETGRCPDHPGPGPGGEDGHQDHIPVRHV